MIVRLARTDTTTHRHLTDRYSGVLSVAEWESCSRRRRTEDQRDYVAAHALSRILLGELLSVPPAAVTIARRQGGHPHVPGVHAPFSLTHTAGFVACAATTHPETIAEWAAMTGNCLRDGRRAAGDRRGFNSRTYSLLVPYPR